MIATLSVGGLVLATGLARPRSTQPGCKPQPPTPGDRGITVVGIGKVTGKPDIAHVTVGIETQAPSLQTAVDDNKAKMNGLAGDAEETRPGR